MIEVGADAEIQAAAFDVSCSRTQQSNNRQQQQQRSPPPEPRAGAADRLLLSDLEHVEALQLQPPAASPPWTHSTIVVVPGHLSLTVMLG